VTLWEGIFIALLCFLLWRYHVRIARLEVDVGAINLAKYVGDALKEGKGIENDGS
jgi:hypothetical protein